MKPLFLNILLMLMGAFLFFSCNDDELNKKSIFENPDETPDPESYSYLLDCWLCDNYLLPYNLQFRYRMQDVETDMDYNLIPAEYEKAIDMAVVTKYLWFDSYTSVAGSHFLKLYGPRMIHLIGSPAYNPVNGTMILGLAEGGIKVTLFRCNQFDPDNIDEMNEMYFKTIHHEFIHILHQLKNYPVDFNLISTNYYEPYSWQDRDFQVAASLGFVSSYAGAEPREDFAEVIANYVVKTDDQWRKILDIASMEPNNADGVDGKAVILQKLVICKQWMKDSWNIDLDRLRNEVQSRQIFIDMDSLRMQLNVYSQKNN